MARYVPQQAAVEAWQWMGVLDVREDCTTSAPEWVVDLLGPDRTKGRDGTLYLEQRGLVLCRRGWEEDILAVGDWLVREYAGKVVFFKNESFCARFISIPEAR